MRLPPNSRAVTALAAAALFVSVPSAFAEIAPTLAGESFFTSGQSPFGPSVAVKTRCNEQGQTKLTFRASGEAFGPYPGSFVEHGTATIGPQSGDPTSGAVLEFESRFVVRSGGTIVVGTKRLGPIRVNAVGSCTDRFPDFNGDGHPETGLYVSVQAQQACYSAVILSPQGRFTEVGSTGIEVSQVFLDATGESAGGLSEVFNGPSDDCSPSSA